MYVHQRVMRTLWWAKVDHKGVIVRTAIVAFLFLQSTLDCAICGPALTGFALPTTCYGHWARVSRSLPLPGAAGCSYGDVRVSVAARWMVLDRRRGGRTALRQMDNDNNAGAPRRRLGSSRAPNTRRQRAPPDGDIAPSVHSPVDSRELTVLRKIVHGCVAALTVLTGFVLGALKLAANVFNYYFQRKRRPIAAYIASWIVHRVLVSVCQEVKGLQVRVDAESSLKLLGGEVTGVTIMASRVRLLDVSVGDVGIYTDDVRFVQAARNGSLSEKLMAMGSASSRSDGVMEIISPQAASLLPSPTEPTASRPDRAEEVKAPQRGRQDPNLNNSEEAGEQEGSEQGEMGGAGGLTVAEPFAASLVASLTEKDVNESPPIMYILKELLTFLVRFGLSIGARKTLGGDQWREESFNSTSVELSYVKLCNDNTLRVDAALALERKSGARNDGAAKLPLTIRLGLDLEDDGRCIIVRQPELVTRGLFRREVYVPFMPLARSGADLGPDFHLSKLQVKEGLIEAEGIVVVRPPTSLTAEQEIAKLEGVGAALESEIDELRRIEMEKRELDSMEKGSHVDRQRMQVEGEIRMSRWRAAERRRRRNQRLITVTEATRRALSPLDTLRAQVNMSAMGTYVNTSAYAAYVQGMNVSAYVNTSAYTQYVRAMNRTRLGEYSMTSSEVLRRVLNSSYSTLQSTYSSVGPLAAALRGSLKGTSFLASLKGEYSLEEALVLQREMEQVQQLASVVNASQPGQSVWGRWGTSRELLRTSSLMRGNSTASLVRAMSPTAAYSEAPFAGQWKAISPANLTRGRSENGDTGEERVRVASARVGQAETWVDLHKIDASTACNDEALRVLLWPAVGGKRAGPGLEMPVVNDMDEAMDRPAASAIGDGAASDDVALRRMIWPSPSLARGQRAGWKRRGVTGNSARKRSTRENAASWFKNLWGKARTRQDSPPETGHGAISSVQGEAGESDTYAVCQASLEGKEFPSAVDSQNVERKIPREALRGKEPPAVDDDAVGHNQTSKSSKGKQV